MDFIISSYLNSFLENEIIANIVFYMADLPVFAIPVFFISFWLYYTYKKDNEKKHNLLNIFYAIWFCVIINFLIQHVYYVDRPMQSLQNAWRLILDHIPNASFPSDHAGVSITFLTWIFLFWYKKTFYLLLPFFIGMNLSRMIWWIHWPSDILFWSLIWMFIAFIFHKFQNLNIIKKTNNFFIKIANFLKL